MDFARVAPQETPADCSSKDAFWGEERLLGRHRRSLSSTSPEEESKEEKNQQAAKSASPS
jgi:hypothetical protein